MARHHVELRQVSAGSPAWVGDCDGHDTYSGSSYREVKAQWKAHLKSLPFWERMRSQETATMIGSPVRLWHETGPWARACGTSSIRDEDGTVWSMAGTCPLDLGHVGPHMYARRHPDAVRIPQGEEEAPAADPPGARRFQVWVGTPDSTFLWSTFDTLDEGLEEAEYLAAPHHKRLVRSWVVDRAAAEEAAIRRAVHQTIQEQP